VALVGGGPRALVAHAVGPLRHPGRGRPVDRAAFTRDAGGRVVPRRAVVYQTQSGDWFGLPTFPTPDKPGPATIAKAALSGTLVSHGVPTGVAPGTFSAVFSDGATSSSDPGQVTVPVFTAPAGHAVHVVGRGRVKATVTVNGDATQLFFRLIDKATGGVVDLQTEPWNRRRTPETARDHRRPGRRRLRASGRRHARAPGLDVDGLLLSQPWPSPGHHRRWRGQRPGPDFQSVVRR